MNTSLKVMVLVCLTSSACSGPDVSAPDTHGATESPAAADEVGESTQAIFQGTVGGTAGAVGISFRDAACTQASCNPSWCTGALVGSRQIITAGHCVVDAKWQGNGVPHQFTGRAAVTYLNPRLGHFVCLTRAKGLAIGPCNDSDDSNDNDFSTFTGAVHPNFTGSTTVRFDMSVLANSFNWAGGVDQRDFARFATGSVRNGVAGAAARVNDLFTAVGFGVDGTNRVPAGNQGILRFDPDPVHIDSVSAGVISNTATTVRMCRGDSGSPALVSPPTGEAITFGIHSKSDTIETSNSCTKAGTKQYWAQLELETNFLYQTLQAFGGNCFAANYAFSPSLLMNTIQCS